MSILSIDLHSSKSTIRLSFHFQNVTYESLDLNPADFWRFLIVFIPPLPEGGGGYTVLPLSVCPSVQDIFCHIFLSNCWWQKSDIGSQASYRYTHRYENWESSNGLFDWLKQIVQPIKKPVRTLSIFTSMAFVKDANGISFKNRLKGHINWHKVRNFIIIWMDESI